MAANMLLRGESGLIHSVNSLLNTSLDSHVFGQYPNKIQSVFELVESIMIKMATSPVAIYENISNDVFCHLVASTDFSYHIKLAKAFFEIIDAIFAEKKKNRAEAFKNRVLFKCSYLISLLVRNSNEECRSYIFE